MPLTEIKVKNAKAKDKVYRLSDEKGLCLEINPKGAKYWRHRYRYHGKEKMMAYGVYPEVSLKEARKKRDESRKLLSDGVDPMEAKRLRKLRKLTEANNSFKLVAEEWFEKQDSTWANSTSKKRRALLENDLYPWLGARAITEITAIELLQVLNRIVDRGALDTAFNGRQVLGQIFRYARLTQRCQHDPASDLRGALPKKITNHRAAIVEPDAFADLLIKIDGYQGTHIVRSLLALCPLLFQRPGEMISMEWSELDFELAEWRIPAEKMKMGIEHIVSLSNQALAILQDIHPLTSRSKYVFPSQSKRRTHHVSNGTINNALRKLGVDTKTEHCAHGFRASARTMLDEQLDYRIEWIEHQIAHQVRDRVLP